MRQFYDGWREEIDGIEFRVRRGRKGPDDLVLEWWTGEDGSGWRKPTFASLGAVFNFLYENEDALYPPDSGYDGGERVVKFLRDVVHTGWQRAMHKVKAEKQSARERAVPAGRRVS